MASRKAMLQARSQAVAEMFEGVEGERSQLVVRRDGTARQREILVNGSIRLAWKSNGDSVPVDLPPGTYPLKGIIIGDAGQTWGFAVVNPTNQPLRAGVLTALGADSFDAQVTIP